MFQLQGQSIRTICQGDSELSVTPRTCWWCRGVKEMEKPCPCSGQGHWPCLQRNTPGVSRMLSRSLLSQHSCFPQCSLQHLQICKGAHGVCHRLGTSQPAQWRAALGLWEETHSRKTSDPPNLPRERSSSEFRCPHSILVWKSPECFPWDWRAE